MYTRLLTGLALFLALSPPALGAKAEFDALRLLHRRVDRLDDMVQRRAEEMTGGHLLARMPQPPPAGPSPSTAADPTRADPANIDQAQVDATISAACTAALGPISTVSNEAGFLGCYNIPFLSMDTGVFEADLRLYQVSQPSGAFAGVKLTDVNVQVSYPHAAFSTIPRMEKRENDLGAQQNPPPMNELQDFLFVGQVNNTLTLTKLEE